MGLLKFFLLILLPLVHGMNKDDFDRALPTMTVVRKFHGLRTPNDSINQRYLKNWADVADKICCRHT